LLDDAMVALVEVGAHWAPPGNRSFSTAGGMELTLSQEVGPAVHDGPVAAGTREHGPLLRDDSLVPGGGLDLRPRERGVHGADRDVLELEVNLVGYLTIISE